MLTFYDVSTVTLSGTVSVANTAQYNKGTPCPVVGAQVCAVNHYGIHEKIVCTTTDAHGTFQFLAMKWHGVIFCHYIQFRRVQTCGRHGLVC